MNKLTQAQVENAKNLCCEKCGCELMKQVTVIKTVSGLLTGDNKDTFIPVPVFACNKCDHVNSIFAKDLKLNDVAHVQV